MGRIACAFFFTLLMTACGGITSTVDLPPVPVSSETQAAAATTMTRWPTVSRAGATPLLTPTSTPGISPTPRPCAETEGTVLEDAFTSTVTAQIVRYRIYLPPCYSTSGKRYPVLYLLHGFDPPNYAMDDDQWDRLGVDEAATTGFRAGILPPVVIVMPNGNDSYYGDEGYAAIFPQVVTGELIPWVDSHYCSWAEASGRAIGGLSRGGFWALYIAFKFPELFSRVGAHSPYIYPSENPATANPYNLVDTAPGLESLWMYFDHGTADYNLVMTNTADFVSRLSGRGADVQYIVNEDASGHVEAYWNAHVAEYLAFYSAGWSLDVDAYPQCEAK